MALGHLTRVSVYGLLVLFFPRSQTTVADTIAHVISSSGAVNMRPTATAPQRRAVAATVPGWFWSGAPVPTPFGVAWEELYSVRPAACKTLIMICLARGCPRQRCCPLFNRIDVLVGHVCTGVARVCEQESSEDFFLATGEEPRHIDV